MPKVCLPLVSELKLTSIQKQQMWPFFNFSSAYRGDPEADAEKTDPGSQSEVRGTRGHLNAYWRVSVSGPSRLIINTDYVGLNMDILITF